MQWTMSMIRAVADDSGSHFFDRKTFKFFGDSMRNFRIVGKPPPTASLEPLQFRRTRHTGKIGPKVYTFDPRTGRIT